MRKFQGTKVPGPFRSGERKFQLARRPRNERARERKGQGAKVPGSELARVLLVDSLRVANWPGSEKGANLFMDNSCDSSRVDSYRYAYRCFSDSCQHGYYRSYGKHSGVCTADGLAIWTTDVRQPSRSCFRLRPEYWNGEIIYVRAHLREVREITETNA